MYVHRMRDSLDADGMPAAWEQRVVGQSIMTGTAMEMMIGDSGVDPTSVEGATNLPYAIPNFRVGLHTTNADVPVTVQLSLIHISEPTRLVHSSRMPSSA